MPTLGTIAKTAGITLAVMFVFYRAEKQVPAFGTLVRG